MELHRIVSAEMLPGLRLRLRFEDGFEGVASLAETVRLGHALAVLAADPSGFRLTASGRAVAWTDADGDDVDLCADALRLMIEEHRVAAG